MPIRVATLIVAGCVALGAVAPFPATAQATSAPAPASPQASSGGCDRSLELCLSPASVFEDGARATLTQRLAPTKACRNGAMHRHWTVVDGVWVNGPTMATSSCRYSVRPSRAPLPGLLPISTSAGLPGQCLVGASLCVDTRVVPYDLGARQMRVSGIRKSDGCQLRQVYLRGRTGPTWMHLAWHVTCEPAPRAATSQQ